MFDSRVTQLTFSQHLACIQKIVKAYHLFVEDRTSNGYEFQDVRGFIGSQNIYVCVNYTNKTITWRDKNLGEEKTYRF